MRGHPVWEAELAHGADQIVCTMAEDSGEDGEEGEEDGGPVGDVGDEEVVDMDAALGGKGEVQQEYDGQHGECESWFEW
jgi:hypothetical protein